jgi:ATPase subunit of ABC transporter with duplicated ATPase domains
VNVLRVQGLAVQVAGRTLVEDLSLTLREGDTLGVVGRNGAGKTSLLRVLAGEDAPLRGRIVRRGALGYLRQEPRRRGGEEAASGLSHLLQARDLERMAVKLEKARLILEERPSPRNVARFSRLEERYRAVGGYSGEADARRIAAGLGLSDGRLELPMAALSGGERRRLDLAAILFGGSDLLLLDEPTNHLDGDAKAWLMSFLDSFRGALVVVSHDLALLDASITRILHLDRGAVVLYRGTYSRYRAAREADERRMAALAERQQAEIGRLRTLADSMRGQGGKRARKAKTLDTRVERLRSHAVAAPARERTVRYRLPEPPHSGRDVLEARALCKSYGGPAVIDDLSLGVSRGERLLVMGLNGAGKTSLLRLLAGVSPADSGAVRLGAGVRLGYYAQEHEGIRAGLRVLDHLRVGSTATDQDLRTLLGMFGLSGSVAFRDAGSLSGGEKTKLALAQLVAGSCNLILLDEPTNNLDPPSRTAVAEALSRWPGTMIVVSHDTDFVSALAPQRVLMMPEGTLEGWTDDLLELVALD